MTSPHPERGAIITLEVASQNGPAWCAFRDDERDSFLCGHGATAEQAKAHLIQQERDRGES